MHERSFGDSSCDCKVFEDAKRRDEDRSLNEAWSVDQHPVTMRNLEMMNVVVVTDDGCRTGHAGSQECDNDKSRPNGLLKLAAIVTSRVAVGRVIELLSGSFHDLRDVVDRDHAITCERSLQRRSPKRIGVVQSPRELQAAAASV